MKNLATILSLVLLLTRFAAFGQSNGNPAPYCNGGYTSGNCNQGGPSNNSGNWVNDFINTFQTSGGVDNISNVNSGCNGGPNNYNFYCQYFLSVNAGATITCTLQSGITFPQGFAIFIDWNQDNTFTVPSERVAGTSNVPAAASYTTLTFTVPANQPAGVYRMRVRCAYATPGTNITPCGTFGYGETEDYNLYVGTPPANSGPISATVTSNSPVCAGQTLSLSVATNYSTALNYTWTGPNSFSNNAANPTIPSAQPASNGTYTVLITNSVCPVTRTVSMRVVAYPNFTPSPTSFSVCQGGNFNAAVSFSPGQNASAMNYFWTAPAPPPCAGRQHGVESILPADAHSAAHAFSHQLSGDVDLQHYRERHFIVLPGNEDTRFNRKQPAHANAEPATSRL